MNVLKWSWRSDVLNFIQKWGHINYDMHILHMHNAYILHVAFYDWNFVALFDQIENKGGGGKVIMQGKLIAVAYTLRTY